MSDAKKDITKPLPPIKSMANGIKAVNWGNSQKLYDDTNYSFRKLDISVTDEAIAYTFAQYVIRGEKSTRWISYNKDALYHIRRGKAWFMIGEDATTLEAGYYVCVPKNTRHRILNNFNDADCVVDLIFPGGIVVD